MTLWLKGVSLVQPVSGKHTAFQKSSVQRGATCWTDWHVSLNLVWKLHCQIIQNQHREIFNIQMDLLLVTFPKHLSFGFWIQKFFSRLPSELLDAGSYPQIMNMIFNPFSVAFKIITPFCPKKGPSHFFVRHVDYWPQIHSAHRVPKFQGQNPKFPATSISLNVNYRAARHRDRFLGDPLGLVFCRGPDLVGWNGTMEMQLSDPSTS